MSRAFSKFRVGGASVVVAFVASMVLIAPPVYADDTPVPTPTESAQVSGTTDPVVEPEPEPDAGVPQEAQTEPVSEPQPEPTQPKQPTEPVGAPPADSTVDSSSDTAASDEGEPTQEDAAVTDEPADTSDADAPADPEPGTPGKAPAINEEAAETSADVADDFIAAHFAIVPYFFQGKPAIVVEFSPYYQGDGEVSATLGVHVKATSFDYDRYIALDTFDFNTIRRGMSYSNLVNVPVGEYLVTPTINGKELAGVEARPASVPNSLYNGQSAWMPAFTQTFLTKECAADGEVPPLVHEGVTEPGESIIELYIDGKQVPGDAEVRVEAGEHEYSYVVMNDETRQFATSPVKTFTTEACEVPPTDPVVYAPSKPTFENHLYESGLPYVLVTIPEVTDGQGYYTLFSEKVEAGEHEVPGAEVRAGFEFADGFTAPDGWYPWIHVYDWVDSVDPTDPTNPTDPTDPTDPVDPENPGTENPGTPGTGTPGNGGESGGGTNTGNTGGASPGAGGNTGNGSTGSGTTKPNVGGNSNTGGTVNAGTNNGVSTPVGATGGGVPDGSAQAGSDGASDNSGGTDDSTVSGSDEEASGGSSDEQNDSADSGESQLELSDAADSSGVPIGAFVLIGAVALALLAALLLIFFMWRRNRSSVG